MRFGRSLECSEKKIAYLDQRPDDITRERNELTTLFMVVRVAMGNTAAVQPGIAKRRAHLHSK